ncbi:MAG: hypothetical protein HN948_04745 [Clostridia bacterium]|jgi:neutral ceramidase|nr:hypothetical protein [Clostridia bacterium]MBT7122298.1 hypothetical protein [Clostridia bacterium]
MSIKAGVEIRDISPKQGLPLGGYPHYPRHNTGVHDPLCACCIYLTDGVKEIAVVAMDLLFFSKKYVTAVRDRVFAECGIAPESIMISCEHTHSGPWAAGGIDDETLYDNEDMGYVNELLNKLVSAIVQAKSGAFDAQVAVTKGYCGPEQGIGGNRRDPKGPADTDVCTIAVADMNDVVRGIYVNYALHPTVIHEDSTVVTADFPGYTRTYLKEKYPQASLCYAQGASGNQSSRYFRQGQDFNEAKRIGEQIGKAAQKAIESAQFSTDMKIDAQSETMKIKTRHIPPMDQLKADVAKFGKIYEDMKAADAPYLDVQNANLKHLGAEDFLGLTKANAKGDLRLLNEEDPAELQVLSIGEHRIVSMPGEVFVDFALEIKNRSPYANTFVTTLAGGCLPGYVCTKESYALGGYETGASLLDPSFGYDMVETIIDMLTEK